MTMQSFISYGGSYIKAVQNFINKSSFFWPVQSFHCQFDSQLLSLGDLRTYETISIQCFLFLWPGSWPRVSSRLCCSLPCINFSLSSCQSKAAYVLFYQRQDKICHPTPLAASTSTSACGNEEDYAACCDSHSKELANRDFMDVDWPSPCFPSPFATGGQPYTFPSLNWREQLDSLQGQQLLRALE